MTLNRRGEPPRPGAHVTLGGGGTLIAATFDLRGAAQGSWDITIELPDGATITQPAAFTVEPGEPEHVECFLVGTDTPLFDRDTWYEIVVVNHSNVDAIGACVILLPGDTPWALDPAPPDATYPVSGVSTPGGEAVVFQPPILPPGDEARIRFRVHFSPLPNETGHRQIGVWSLPGPGRTPGESPWDSFFTCMLAVTSEAVNLVDLSLPISPVCVSTAVGNLFGALAGSGPSFAIDHFEGGGVGTSGWQVLTSAVATGIDCVAGRATGVGQIAQVANILMQGYCTIVACSDVPWQKIYELLLAYAKDPNELRGPPGAGPERYLPAGAPLDYQVEFENLPEATAAAQAVVVQVTLDPSMDLSRFAFGPIHVAERALTPPPGATSYEGQLDLRLTQQVVLEVSARLDIPGRRAVWQFQAIDPGTGLAPTNPFLGFLPPDHNPPEGVGVVNFQVPLLADTPTGTPIEAQASIVFDRNPAIETGVWRNTLDTAPPESAPTSLPASSPSTLSLTWTSADEGAGVADVRVEVSDDGGPFVGLDLPRGAASATFVGVSGHRYAFRTRARDGVGNLQDGWSPTVTTQIGAAPAPEKEGCGCHVVSGPQVVLALGLLGLRRRRAR